MKFIVFAFILISSYSWTQINPYYYASLSYSMDKLGYKSLADSLMDYSFKLKNNENIQARLYIKSGSLKAQLGNRKKSSQMFQLAVQNGADSAFVIKQIRKEKLNDSLFLIQFVRKNYQKDRMIHLYKRDENAMYMISELNAMDQGIRKIVDADIPNVNKDCIASLAENNVGILYDYFYQYLKNHSFPSVDEVGYKAIDDISTFTLHFGSELDTAFNFLDGVLKNAIVDKGYIPNYYAVFVDFHRRKIGLNDYYGNEMFKKNDDGSYSYYPIEDISKVDLRRSEIGLIPLYFHSIQWNMKLPEGYEFNLERFITELRKSVGSNN